MIEKRICKVFSFLRGLKYNNISGMSFGKETPEKREVEHTIKILVGYNQSLTALLIFGSRTKPLDGFGHLPQYSQINTYGRKVPKIGYFGMGQIQ